MRILFLTTLMPGALSSGSEVASQAFADGLRALGHEVRLVGYRRAGDAPPLHDDDVVAADRHIETDSAGAQAALWMARALATRQPYSVAKYVSRAYSRTVATEVQRARPELVVVDHAQMGWAAPAGVPYVLVAHNVEHRLYEELAAGGGARARLNGREAKLMRGLEGRLCREARAVWTLTAEDAGTLGGTHFDIPAAVDPPPPPGAAACDVALLGSWTWAANAAGLEWFLREVRPLLPPGLTVEVAGSGSDGLEGVRARGRVPDAMAFLQSARVVAVPSVAGAGVQIKTLDAIASGRHVVATPTAMRGISDPPPTVTVADDPAAFAQAIADSVARDGDAGGTAAEWSRARRARFREQLRAAL